MCWLSRKGCRNGGPVPPPSPVRRETLGMAVGFVGVVCFAGTLPAMRLAVPYLDPWFLTSARAAIAGVIASVALLVMRRRPPPLAQWHAFAIASACLVWGFPLFSAIAMVTVPASNGGVILGILPLGTAIAAAFVVGERPSSGFWLAAAAGTAIVIAFSLRQNSGGLTLGDVLLLLTVVAGSVGYAYGGKLSVSYSGWEVIAWQLVLSLPIAVPATILLWPDNAAMVPAPAWGALLYVALFSQLIGFFFWNAGLALGGIARVGQMQLLQPFVIVFMAALVNGEAIELETLSFATAVVLTVVMGSRMRVARPV
ncbi:MAG: DMT family transporter [Rhizobiales bacterium]|nr:DMT family transporter [Hyphomicrobiales bacterium]